MLLNMVHFENGIYLIPSLKFYIFQSIMKVGIGVMPFLGVKMNYIAKIINKRKMSVPKDHPAGSYL